MTEVQKTPESIKIDSAIAAIQNQRNSALDQVAHLAGENAVLLSRIAQLEAANKELADKAALDGAEIEKLKRLIKNPLGQKKAS